VVRQAVIAAVLACVLATSATAAATGWRVIKSGSSTGDFAIKSITATVNHPVALEVRLIGDVTNGTSVVSCTKGVGGGAAWSRTYTRAGTFRLPMTRGADSCDVVAAVGGSGRVTVQILAYR
jgi:hypothetical protein